ncbi:uncharacterized protein LOC123892283 [Trifolium pratense]|uniref:uncharacterized protein LOC123892283 n=1 Tax=Trifolium pratense TaxID=57577 RepID=UPI001E696DA3|nr:uncharacterized protein LOC123892283 [Trifolium pratense]
MEVDPSQPFIFTTPANNKPPDQGGTLNNNHVHQRVSFKDKVIGTNTVPAARPRVDLIGEKLAHIEYKDNDRLQPMVHINDSVFEGLDAPLKDALVVKLLGKNIGFHLMKERLQKIWRLNAGFDIMNIGNGFFMVKLDSIDDRTRIMDGGPWMIYDHYLTVQCWSQEFASPTAKIDKTMVWIRFPGLNLFYYDESILLALASAVGRPIKVDSTTLDVRRGRFARVCVEINLNQPVVGKVWIRDYWYQVEYEGLHRICSTCGCYGHLTRGCKSTLTRPSAGTPATATQTQSAADLQQHAVSSTHHNDRVNAPVLLDANQGNPDTIIENKLNGDWLVVKRKVKKSSGSKSSKHGMDLNMKSNNGKDLNNKGNKNVIQSHALRDSSLKSHVKKSNNHPSQANGAHLLKTKPSEGVTTINHKRQRQDPISLADSHATQLACNALSIPNNNMHFKNNDPLDAGFGARPTVNMQAISNNRFILLHDEGDTCNSNHDGAACMDGVGGESQEHSTPNVNTQDEVQETPSDDMAT